MSEKTERRRRATSAGSIFGHDSCFAASVVSRSFVSIHVSILTHRLPYPLHCYCRHTGLPSTSWHLPRWRTAQSRSTTSPSNTASTHPTSPSPSAPSSLPSTFLISIGGRAGPATSFARSVGSYSICPLPCSSFSRLIATPTVPSACSPSSHPCGWS